MYSFDYFLSRTDIMKSRQISNILTPGFLLKCKTDYILSRTNQNRRINDKDIELELYCNN